MDSATTPSFVCLLGYLALAVWQPTARLVGGPACRLNRGQYRHYLRGNGMTRFSG
jgi:hypothetical protein